MHNEAQNDVDYNLLLNREINDLDPYESDPSSFLDAFGLEDKHSKKSKSKAKSKSKTKKGSKAKSIKPSPKPCKKGDLTCIEYRKLYKQYREQRKKIFDGYR